MNEQIKTIVFDYGGTLDTDGIHWSEKFWEAYQYFKVPVLKEDFRKAFVYSERKIPEIIKPDYSLIRTYRTQITHQMEYFIKSGLLISESRDLVEKLSEYSYSSVIEQIPKTKQILGELKPTYKLGLVSNYYGNVKMVLTELGLASFFDSITDSADVGIRKPDKRIFQHTLEKLNAVPNETIVVGDSYKNDISPAKSIGCKTIWIKGKSWDNAENIDDADLIINTIKELTEAIKSI